MNLDLANLTQSPAASRQTFQRFVVAVWIAAFIYSGVNYYCGAYLAFVVVLSASLFWQPLIFVLAKVGYLEFAKFLQVTCGAAYIYIAGGIGWDNSIASEIYLIPAMLAPILFFDRSSRAEILFSIAAMVSAGIALHVFGSDFVPRAWLPDPRYAGFVKIGGFIGAVGITVHFALLFRQAFLSSQVLLNEAESVAKLGSWSLEPASRRMLWTRQMFELLGLSFQDGVPEYERFRSLIHPADRSAWDSAVETCIKQGEAFDLRFRVSQSDADRWIHAIGRGRRGVPGAIEALTGTCQDVTAIVESEGLVKQERAKALHAAKLASLGELAASVAHEINNPLAIIGGAARGVIKARSDVGKLEKKVEIINRSITRISRIVDGLRRFSRAEEASPHERADLTAILGEAISLTEARTNRDGVAIEVETEGSAWTLCDVVEIEQVLINLINNAIDATEGLDERWVRLTLSSKDGTHILWVTDSGAGMSQAVAEKIFQPFYTSKPSGKGTGLGLSICKGILDDHNATIEVLWELPNTTFELVFLAAQEELKVG